MMERKSVALCHVLVFALMVAALLFFSIYLSLLPSIFGLRGNAVALHQLFILAEEIFHKYTQLHLC